MGRKFGKIIRNKIAVSNSLLREFLAELVGTFCLVGMGTGANAMYVLTPRLNTYLSVQLGWGFSAALAAWTCFGITGAHINPAVTLAMTVVGRSKWIKVPIYWLAQYLGAFVGAACVYLVYYDALNYFDGGYRTVVGGNATAGIFVTFPQPYLTTLGGFADQLILLVSSDRTAVAGFDFEIIAWTVQRITDGSDTDRADVYGTMMLLLFLMALTDGKNCAPSPNFAPLFIGLTVATIGMTFGMNCGYAINPARDLSPRIFTAIAGWGTEVFTAYNCWSWVPVVAPQVGGVLGALIYMAGVGAHRHHLGEPVSQ